ncbi:unnamed protein product [Meganyctiphanes norvegica]|uniref:MD-2-related lipid-recognition domain-containing protein n=1 Tax=Meganyctiphanes norvegica TaxID=48144 RepID=A0AAV2PMH9_MEGNR
METWSKTCLRFLLVICSLITTGNALRADLKKGFRMCPGKQLGRVVAVYADGPGCRRSNGADQWPCFIVPRKYGQFQIEFMHDTVDKYGTSVAFGGIRSSIHAHVFVRGVPSFTGEQHVGLSGEVGKNACPETYYESVEGPYFGCPIQPGVVHIIQKNITVPNSVRFAQSDMKVEFKLTNLRGQTIVCFQAPIISL